jgi:hypothetical protein
MKNHSQKLSNLRDSSNRIPNEEYTGESIMNKNNFTNIQQNLTPFPNKVYLEQDKFLDEKIGDEKFRDTLYLSRAHFPDTSYS